MDNTSQIYREDAGSHLVSAVSWPAILAGAFSALAVSLVLLILGSGLGFAAMSPWTQGFSITGLTVTTIIWLIIMQWAASAFGGYIAGRLRTRWHGVHTDEVFFRDTAHGFLTWAVATVFAVGFLASAMSATVSGGTQAAAMVASGAAAGAASKPIDHDQALNDPLAYYVDSLYRSNKPVQGDEHNVRMETNRIFATGLKEGLFSDEDKTYLAQSVSARTGLSQTEAQARVDNTINKANADADKARVAADKARKAAASFSIFTALAMMIGAFVASVSAALGGKLRDEHL